MLTRWLRSSKDVPTAPVCLLGIAVAVTDPNAEQLHVGVVHRGASSAAQVLHLAWHADLQADPLSGTDIEFYWVEFDLDPDRVETMAAFCRRVSRRRPSVPYGIWYEGGALQDDGAAELKGKEIGLTCATYVLALLEWGGIRLLSIENWPSRPEDASWHRGIVRALRKHQRRNPDSISDEHIARVEQDGGCARFRPEEVTAGCCEYAGAPVGHEVAWQLGEQLRVALLA